ncbi:hypothetical protein LIER_42065 [Lithospermum erythrorhizon]|uniref:Uncharacterized protein n=1 Tax=Lithospermum erythrorhizon TaxID=34254 RepID=A0AAV3RLY1_LITER
MYNIGEEYDGEEETRPEYLCPFCAEDFDIVGLCCHIDEEHSVEAKNGECPVCAKRVGVDLVGHITAQHSNLLKISFFLRYRRGGSNSPLAILRRELQEGNLQQLLGGSSLTSSPEPDPLLSSFMFNAAGVDVSPSMHPSTFAEEYPAVESSVETSPKRKVEQPPVSDKDQEEESRKCKFVQGLLTSTFLDGDKL